MHLIHEWAWAGTPNEGAAWLRLQRLADTWHRVLLIPVTGGVIVGMIHGLLEILDQIKQSSSSQRQGFDLLAGVFPTVKAIQAAVTLGTGCSLGPEGPSVDIGKSCANGFSLMMENNRERRIALVAAGAAAGISSGGQAILSKSFFKTHFSVCSFHILVTKASLELFNGDLTKEKVRKKNPLLMFKSLLIGRINIWMKYSQELKFWLFTVKPKA